MLWAKTRSHARYNLASSGVAHYSLSGLPVRLEELELSGPSAYGYAPLQKALAAKCGVPEECVVAATGTALANHLAMAATVAPGDEVLIEQPAYEPLVALAHYFGAEVKRFERSFDEGFRVDPREVERKLTSRTRLIVLTNLYNPTSALITRDVLGRVGEAARAIGARVLVDEVYLDAMFEEAPPTAFSLGEEFIVTSSLTKAYGLSGLRCGWVLAAPALAERMWRLNDLFGVIPAHVAELLSVVALEHLDEVAARARRLIETNRRLLDAFLDARSDLECVRPNFGTVVFPRLKGGGDTEALCRLLRERYETSVVPGSFFEMPAHFRIGLGGNSETMAEGLRRVGLALDDMAAESGISAS
jgi:aspartate/methionine/tyrosine aminotransferase